MDSVTATPLFQNQTHQLSFMYVIIGRVEQCAAHVDTVAKAAQLKI
jgi:hypothetical protein